MTNDAFTPKYVPLAWLPEMATLMEEHKESIHHSAYRYEAIMRISETILERHPGETNYYGRVGVFTDLYGLLEWTEKITARLLGAGHAD